MLKRVFPERLTTFFKNFRNNWYQDNPRESLMSKTLKSSFARISGAGDVTTKRIKTSDYLHN